MNVFVQFVFVIFCQKEIGTEAAGKMLVKLTTGLRQNLHPVLSKRRPDEIRFACVQSIRRKSRKNH